MSTFFCVNLCQILIELNWIELFGAHESSRGGGGHFHNDGVRGRATAGEGRYDFPVITIDTGYLNRPNWLKMVGFSVLSQGCFPAGFSAHIVCDRVYFLCAEWFETGSQVFTPPPPTPGGTSPSPSYGGAPPAGGGGGGGRVSPQKRNAQFSFLWYSKI